MEYLEHLTGIFWNIFADPFVSFGFMRKALVGSFAVAVGCAPLGLLMIYRRMSLLGDALSHAILPGIALGFFFFAGSPIAMMVGGLATALIVAALSQSVSLHGKHSHESAFSVFYLFSLALGILLITLRGTPLDLLHILFGNIITLSSLSLILVIGTSLATLSIGLLGAQTWIILTVDPEYLKNRSIWAFAAMALMIFNMVSAFQAMGTLLAIGILLIPAATAHFWSHRLSILFIVTIGLGMLASYLGLLLSFHWNWPAGPTIILILGGMFFLSFLLGSEKGIITPFRKEEAAHSSPHPILTYFWGVLMASCLLSPFALPSQSFGAPPRLKIACTTPVGCDLLKAMAPQASQRIEIHTMVGPQGNNHHFEPRPETLKLLKSIDFIVTNGLQYETWLEPLLKNNRLKIQIKEMSQGIQALADSNHLPDPHAWHNPLNGIRYAENIKNILIEKAPTFRENIESQFKIIQQALLDLDQEQLNLFKEPPYLQSHIVLPHPFLRYFADRYGLTSQIQSMTQNSHFGELPAKELKNLVVEFKKKTPLYLFSEYPEIEAPILVLSRELKKPVAGALYSEALIPEKECAQEVSCYIATLKRNRDLLKKVISSSRIPPNSN